MNTAVMLTCKCHWQGIATTHKEAHQEWLNHAFDALGGSHGIVTTCVVDNPITDIRRTRAEQSALAQVQGRRQYERSL